MSYSNRILEAIRKQKENPTPAEILMAQKLNFRNIRFKFIYPVVLESKFFTADFYIPQHSLIIEIDGGYHNRKDQNMRDMCKDIVYESLGYNVLRIKNHEVDTFDTLSIRIFEKKSIIKNVNRKFNKQHLKGRRCNNQQSQSI